MIEIYTREGCPRCLTTKAALASCGLEYRELFIGRDVTRDTVLETFPDQRSLPIITVDGSVVTLNHFGDCNV